MTLHNGIDKEHRKVLHVYVLYPDLQVGLTAMVFPMAVYMKPH